MNDIKYMSYHVEAFVNQCCTCGWNTKHLLMQWDSTYVINEETLKKIFRTCEGSVDDHIVEFKNWYLLAGKYVTDPDELPF